jgi:hypothetical protein
MYKVCARLDSVRKKKGKAIKAPTNIQRSNTIIYRKTITVSIYQQRSPEQLQVVFEKKSWQAYPTSRLVPQLITIPEIME